VQNIVTSNRLSLALLTKSLRISAVFARIREGNTSAPRAMHLQLDGRRARFLHVVAADAGLDRASASTDELLSVLIEELRERPRTDVD
jgi:hypothetical protein